MFLYNGYNKWPQIILFNIVHHSMDGWQIIVSGIHFFHVSLQGATTIVIDNTVTSCVQEGCNLMSTIPAKIICNINTFYLATMSYYQGKMKK